MCRQVTYLPLSPVCPAWPNHLFFLSQLNPFWYRHCLFLVSFVMHHQNDTIQSTGETVHLRLDLPQRMQLPVNNPLFTSFIISHKSGNNCVLLYPTMTTKNIKRKQLLCFLVRLWGTPAGKMGVPLSMWQRSLHLASDGTKPVLIYHILFACLLWVRNKIKFGYSCSLGQILHLWYRQSSFLHLANASCKNGLFVSLVQDLAKKPLIPELDSYMKGFVWKMWWLWGRTLTLHMESCGFVFHS